MNGFQRLLRSILKRGKSGYGDGATDAEAHRVAMNGTRQQCLVLMRQRHLDDKTLELLARRRFDDVRPLVVWHGSMTTDLARRLLRIHDPSLRDLLVQRFPEIEDAAEGAADDREEASIAYVAYQGTSVERTPPQHEDHPQDPEFVEPFLPVHVDTPDHLALDEPDEDDDSHAAVVLATGSTEPPDDEGAAALPPDDGVGADSDLHPTPTPVGQPQPEAAADARPEPDLDGVVLDPTEGMSGDLSPELPEAPTGQSIDDESEIAADDWDENDLAHLLDIAAATRTAPEDLSPSPSPVRRQDVLDKDDSAEAYLLRILEYVPTGSEAKELAARIADKRLGSLLTWLARFREAGRSPDEIVVAWHVRTTWNELRPMSRFEYPISWATTFRLLDSMPGVPDSGAALDILERIERRWRHHDCQKHTSLSAYVERVLQDYARSTANGGNVPIDALFQ